MVVAGGLGPAATMPVSALQPQHSAQCQNRPDGLYAVCRYCYIPAWRVVLGPEYSMSACGQSAA